MERFSLLVVLLLTYGCSSSYESVETFKYEIPPLYVSEKDCQAGACVEIVNYDISCEELSFSYGYGYCQVYINFKYDAPDYRYDITDYMYDSGDDIECMASIDAFENYSYRPSSLSVIDNKYVNYSGNFTTTHYFGFRSYSETNRVYVTGIECGIDQIPSRPLTEEQKAAMDIYLRPLCLSEDYVIKSPWDFCIKYIEEQKAEME